MIINDDSEQHCSECDKTIPFGAEIGAVTEFRWGTHVLCKQCAER